LRDVAERAGVSPITASRALRGVGRVDPLLAERVHAAARALNYVPDPAARALASARSSVVVLLVPSLSNLVFMELIEAVHDVLEPAGYQVLIGNTRYDHGAQERLLHQYLSHRPSGLLLTRSDQTDGARVLTDDSGIPHVYLMDLSDDGAYCVGLSQRDAGRCVADHLLATGRRRIAFVAAQLDARTRQREAGYRGALTAAGIYDPDLSLLTPDRSSIGLGAQLLRQLFARRPDVDAIFFNNDDLAQGALLEALRLGIDVPDQVAIVGFNDLEGSAHLLPRLTTVRTPRAEIGRRAATMLLDLMQGRRVARPALDLGFELIVREST
jgi:LacI family gluconate utilization system Gnt-I transcriptional repressor